MRGPGIFSKLRPALTSVLVTLAFASFPARAATDVVLSSSISPVATLGPTHSGAPTRPYVSRKTLTSAEAAAPLDFEVVLKMRNFAELRARVARGEHLSAGEMSSKYEPSAADYQAVVDWANQQGFTITREDPRHVTLFLRAKISHIAEALKVDFARVNAHGQEYSSAITAPTVPATLSPTLIGINGLQPHLRAHKHLVAALPDVVYGTASYFPSQIAQAYGAASLYTNDITGAGQTIAIVIDTFPATQDLLEFWKDANINQSISNVAFIQAVSGTLSPPLDSDSLSETTFDTEWSSAIAPGAHIRVYAAIDLEPNHLDEAYQQILDDIASHPDYGIHQMSMSYGILESDEIDAQGQSAQLASDDQTFAQLAANGVTCFAASGDNGATPGYGDSTLTQAQQDALGVDAPADDPNVTGVGGTSLVLDANNNITSEVAWNDGSSDGASGGGPSVYFTHPPTTNSSAPWQTGNGISGSSRQVPDVASAADQRYGAFVCAGAATNVVYGGTSWSAPTWAGFCALINQARANAGQPPLGGLNPSLYPILNSTNYATDFRDITSGSNIIVGTNGYYAGTNYDMVTGLGSPKVQSLLQTLISPSALIGTQMPPAMVSVLPGQSATFTVGSANATAAYQWQQLVPGTSTWSTLADGGTFSGSATSTLTVIDPGTSMSGDQYRCQITFNGGNVITSTPSVLVVQIPLTISTLAGTAQVTGTNNGAAAGATFNYPSGVALDSSNNLFIADYANNQIRELTSTGTVTTPYGYLSAQSGANNAVGNNAAFYYPNAVATDPSGHLFVADTGNNLIRKITSGTVTTFASGTTFSQPQGIATDTNGNVYVADSGNNVIRKITPGGTVTTVAGTVGVAGYTNGPSAGALFNDPTGVAVDTTGDVYVADYGNNVVRKINSGTVTTFAGQPSVYGYLDGSGTNALFNSPIGLSVDPSGNVYVADSFLLATSQTVTIFGNNLLRKITPSGIVSTLAGTAGNFGSADGTGSAAKFYSIQSATLGTNGDAYIADTYNQLIRLGVPVPLPTVTIAATQPTATVFGSTPGQFTVSRTGATTGSLTVKFTTGGTALSGTDYDAIGNSVTIPANSSSAVISVTPLQDNSASSPTVILTVGSDNGYTVGTPASATVVIQEPTAYQAWKIANFGSNATNSAVGGDTAAPGGNGVANLFSYAFNSNPLDPAAHPLPVLSTVTIAGQDYVAVTYTQINNDPNLICTPQVTGDLSGVTDTWHSGSSYTTNAATPVTTGTLTQYTVRDITPVTASGKRFIRVQVTGQ